MKRNCPPVLKLSIFNKHGLQNQSGGSQSSDIFVFFCNSSLEFKSICAKSLLNYLNLKTDVYAANSEFGKLIRLVLVLADSPFI